MRRMSEPSWSEGLECEWLHERPDFSGGYDDDMRLRALLRISDTLAHIEQDLHELVSHADVR